MTKVERLAGLLPSKLWVKPALWHSQRPLLPALLVSLAVTVLFHQFTYPQNAVGWKYLTWVIYGIIAAGFVQTAMMLAKIKVEEAIAFVVEERASDSLAQIKSKEKPRIELGSIETDLLPNNPSMGMIRLFQQILKEAKERKFESVGESMAPYRDELRGDLFKLRGLQRVSLELGILGTFVTMVFSLRHLQKIPMPNGSSQIDFEALVGSLQYAFGTSIAGLEASVFFALLVFLVKKRQEMLFRRMETSTVSVISLARNSINRDDFLFELAQVSASVREVGERVFDQSAKLENQTQEIREGLERLKDSKSAFNQFLGGISTAQEAFLKDMKEVYKVLSPEQVGLKLGETLEKTTRDISGHFKDALGESLAEIRDLRQSSAASIESIAVKFAETLAVRDRLMGSMLHSTGKTLEAHSRELSELKESFGNHFGREKVPPMAESEAKLEYAAPTLGAMAGYAFGDPKMGKPAIGGFWWNLWRYLFPGKTQGKILEPIK